MMGEFAVLLLHAFLFSLMLFLLTLGSKPDGRLFFERGVSHAYLLVCAELICIDLYDTND